MIKIIYNIFLAAMLTGFVSAQNLDFSSAAIFISPSGFPGEVDQNNFYTNYYRQIYQDSKIVNPNYILPSQGSNNFILFYPIGDIGEPYQNLIKKSYLDYISVDQSGKVVIIPGIISQLIQKNISKKREK